MELRQLERFIAVADEGSFTAASDRLQVTQSTVSESVKTLEQELGVELFKRRSQRVQLTDIGETLLAEARATLTAARRVRDAVDAQGAGLRGTVTLGVLNPVPLIDIPHVLAQFRSTHPRVNVKMRHAPGGSSGLIKDLIEGRLDLALVALAEPPAGTHFSRLASYPLQVICSSKHPLATDNEAELKQLRDQTFIEAPPGYGVRTLVDRTFAQAGIERAVAFEVVDPDVVAGLVRHGLGISLMPAHMVARMDGVHALDLRDAPAWTFSLATPSIRPIPASVRALANELLNTGVQELAAAGTRPAAQARTDAHGSPYTSHAREP